MEKMEGIIKSKSLFYQKAISATSDTMVECQAELITKAA
jgi:hypothetical protein